jgi:hypothetical protein
VFKAGTRRMGERVPQAGSERKRESVSGVAVED